MFYVPGPPEWNEYRQLLSSDGLHHLGLQQSMFMCELSSYCRSKHGLLNYTEEHHNSNLTNERKAATELSK